MIIITTITKKSGQMLNQESTISDFEFKKNDSRIQETYYLNLLVAIAFLLISFYYYSINPEMGFTFLFGFFCYGAIILGVKTDDTISRILLILIDLAIGVIGLYIVGGSPVVLIFYAILLFTLYSMIFDSKTNTLFHNKFNSKLWKLDLVILMQYIFLMGTGFLDIKQFTGDFGGFFLYYSIYLFVFMVLLNVQKLSRNARLIMIVLAPLLIIYSLIDIQIKLFAYIGVIINLLTLAVLLFDKNSISEFKKEDNGTYVLFKLVLGLNIITLLGIVSVAISRYQATYNIIYLGGLFLAVIYALMLFKISRYYSTFWKEILSLMLLGMLAFALYYVTINFVIGILFIPTAIISLFVLHFDYPTLQLFRNMKIEKST